MTQENRIEPGKHHVSKTYIPLSVMRGFWIALIIAVAGGLNFIKEADTIMEYVDFSKFMVVIIVASVVILLGIIAIFAAIGYKRLTWEITDEEVHIYKGIIVRKKTHLPFRRIHSVDIEAKILDRIFGVVTVKLDTAAGSAGSEDAKIPALKLSTAELIRAEIFNRKQAAMNDNVAETVTGGGNVLDGLNKENDQLRGFFAGDASGKMTPESEYRLTNKELILLCLANGKAFAIIFASLFFIYEMMDIIHSVDTEFAATADEITKSLLTMGPVILVFIFLAALVISLVISFITKALNYGNFVARRYGERIEISRGLLQKRSTGVAVERIQTLKIKQGLIQRILGYAEISLETASAMAASGNDQERAPGVVIHPFIKINKVEDYMSKMLKEFDNRPQELKKLSGLAKRRSMIRYALWTIILVILPLNITWHILKSGIDFDTEMIGYIDPVNDSVYGFSAFILILMIVIGWAAWKGRAFGRSERYIAMKHGVLGRTKVYIPKKKIQFAYVSQNPFQKRVKLTTIKANTAAMGSSYQSIKDVEKLYGDEYLDWISTGLESRK